VSIVLLILGAALLLWRLHSALTAAPPNDFDAGDNDPYAL
jgi:hypothetical protein